MCAATRRQSWQRTARPCWAGQRPPGAAGSCPGPAQPRTGCAACPAGILTGPPQASVSCQRLLVIRPALCISRMSGGCACFPVGLLLQHLGHRELPEEASLQRLHMTPDPRPDQNAQLPMVVASRMVKALIGCGLQGVRCAQTVHSFMLFSQQRELPACGQLMVTTPEGPQQEGTPLLTGCAPARWPGW